MADYKNVFGIQQGGPDRGFKRHSCYNYGDPNHLLPNCPHPRKNRGGACHNYGDPNQMSPECLHPKKPQEYVLLCRNCREEGHPFSQCPRSPQQRVPPRDVQILPRERTALNYGALITPDPPPPKAPADVWMIKIVDVCKVLTRRREYQDPREVPRLDPVQETRDEVSSPTSRDTSPPFELPDAMEAVLAHLAELGGEQGEKKTTMVV